MHYFIKAGESAIDIQLRDIETNEGSQKIVSNIDTTQSNEHPQKSKQEEIYRPTDPKLRGVKVLGKIELKGDYKMR